MVFAKSSSTVSIDHVWFGLICLGLGLGLVGLGWAGLALVWFGLVWLGWVGLGLV